MDEDNQDQGFEQYDDDDADMDQIVDQPQVLMRNQDPVDKILKAHRAAKTYKKKAYSVKNIGVIKSKLKHHQREAAKLKKILSKLYV